MIKGIIISNFQFTVRKYIIIFLDIFFFFREFFPNSKNSKFHLHQQQGRVTVTNELNHSIHHQSQSLPLRHSESQETKIYLVGTAHNSLKEIEDDDKCHHPNCCLCSMFVCGGPWIWFGIKSFEHQAYYF